MTQRTKTAVGNFLILMLIGLLHIALIIQIAVALKPTAALPKTLTDDLSLLVHHLMREPEASVTVEEYQSVDDCNSNPWRGPLAFDQPDVDSRPVNPGMDMVISTVLLDSYDSDGLPQYMDPAASMPAGCPIPEELWEAVMKLVPAEDRAWVAAVPMAESSYDPTKIGDVGYMDGKSCHSVTGYQIHSHYHPEIYHGLEMDWSNWERAVDGYLKILDKQAEWRGSDSLNRKLSYYVDGGSWHKPKAQAYAKKIMAHAKTLEQWFNAYPST